MILVTHGFHLKICFSIFPASHLATGPKNMGREHSMECGRNTYSSPTLGFPEGKGRAKKMGERVEPRTLVSPGSCPELVSIGT